MADPDPLAPSSAPPSPDSLIRLPGGQLALNPYSGLFAGLSPEQLQAYNVLTDPIFQYTAFGLPPGPPIHILDFSLRLLLIYFRWARSRERHPPLVRNSLPTRQSLAVSSGAIRSTIR
jgi:hypothetical protein